MGKQEGRYGQAMGQTRERLLSDHSRSTLERSRCDAFGRISKAADQVLRHPIQRSVTALIDSWWETRHWHASFRERPTGAAVVVSER
jgi:hypothetical protein